jgi:hypothetical protein
MSAITFSHLTKEIELNGLESFIESNFDKIQELLIESFGVKRKMVSRRTKAKREPMLKGKVLESQTSAEIGRQESSNASQSSSAIITSIKQFSHEIRVNRPPLRKYIRKVGIPGQERIMVEVVEQKPKELTLVEVVEQKPRELTIAELKEKFGLSDSKYGGIIWNDQKQDKTRKVMNGGYV